MNLPSRRLGAAVMALLVQCVIGTPTALSVTPSVQWYGDDGIWSAISIRVGTPPQWLDVTVSTVSSETWVVGPGGCPPSTTCPSARGGLFDLRDSTSWKMEGFFALGADIQLGNSWYAEYGLDNLEFGSTGVTLPGAIIGSMNTTGRTSTTGYLVGQFGVGVVPGSFNGSTPLSAISGLVETLGAIPSHSYGFTAGAHYRGKGVPNSLTLGGYDATRFVPHDVSFQLNPSQQLQVFIASISVANTTISSDLLYSTDQVSVVIDSSTVFLWLPQAVCVRFAETLGLVYDDAMNLYTFPANSSQHANLLASNLTFTFTLSNVLSSPDIVNITLPYTAFDLELTPPSVPENSSLLYFPLRQALVENQFTIGRVFLQEAYIIADYERNNFSIYQAVHTSQPVQNTSIVSITRPSTSNFEGPPKEKAGEIRLSTGAIVGIAVSAISLTALITLAILYFCRQRHKKNENDEKPMTPPRSLLDRLRRRKEPSAHEASGDTCYPTEVGADASHERFELPAPLGPAELDSESGTLDGTTEGGSSTQESANLSAYERARRKIERQQAAARAQTSAEDYPIEKNETDMSPVAHYRPPDVSDEIALVSPLGPESGGSLTIDGGPSPVSPGFNSTLISPASAQPPTYRRIDPTNVVYAGRLPDNVQLPQIVPRMVGRDGRTIRTDETVTDPNSSLGSQFTENESDELYESGETRDEVAMSLPSESSEESEPKPRREFSLRGEQLEESSDPWESRRRLEGEDLVHVPQPAENRFSWEEERTDGTD